MSVGAARSSSKGTDLAVVGQILIGLGLLAPVLGFLVRRIHFGAMLDVALVLIDALKLVFFTGVVCLMIGLLRSRHAAQIAVAARAAAPRGESGSALPLPRTQSSITRLDEGWTARKIAMAAALVMAIIGAASFFGAFGKAADIPSPHKLRSEIAHEMANAFRCPAAPIAFIMTFAIDANGGTVFHSVTVDPSLQAPSAPESVEQCARGQISTWRFATLPPGAFIYVRIPVLMQNGVAAIAPSTPSTRTDLSFVQSDWIVRGEPTALSSRQIERILSKNITRAMSCVLNAGGFAIGQDTKPLNINLKVAPDGSFARVLVGHILQRGAGDWRDSGRVGQCIIDLMHQIPFPGHTENDPIDVPTLIEWEEIVLEG